MHRTPSRAPMRAPILVIALLAAPAAPAAAQPSQSDRSTTDMTVYAYEQHGGPSVLLCRHLETGEQRHTCANTFSGGATMSSSGAGGAIRTQIASWGMGSQWGEVSASVRTQFTGRLGVDLAGYTSLAEVTGAATFHLGGTLHAYAIGPTTYAQASVGYTVRVQGAGAAPPQQHEPFVYGCWLFGCYGRWSTVARGAGSGQQTDVEVDENRVATLALAPGVLNSFDVIFDLLTWTAVSGGGGTAEQPPIWDANAGTHFQNTAGLVSLALSGVDADGNAVDLSAAPITFSEGFGFLPAAPGDIPDLTYGPGVTAAPEPATWALVATGVLGVAGARRRRRA